MSSELIPSNPEEVMVVRQVTPNIHTFSVPFARYGKFLVGGRGSLVKLTSGNLAVFSPTALTEAAKAKVAEQGGNVGYIVALDYEHHIFISEWAKQYPNARIVGPEGLPEKRQQATDPRIGKEPFAVEFKKADKRSIRISEEIDADFDYEYMDGHANKEIVFHYRPDNVLIQADLMFNLPATEQYSKVSPSQRSSGGILNRIFTGIQSTSGDAMWNRRFNWYLARKDKESFHESIKAIDKWNFNAIIPCHGDTIQVNGKEVFRKVFAWDLGRNP
ncbi:hypothetical protein ESCO_002381 [Escovopsis weberi]|uniref:Nuclear protein Qri2/Nse4 n=1 Tax=Escovopsis weberi TaxID=150374 RepID=A0A0M8N2G3_ESCWE|nr:hypothetical protein ESCO_002381 [Escovopsis weberi]